MPSAASPSAEPVRIEEQLCFALYAASRAVTALYRPVLQGLGLTYPQYLVMLVLWDRGALTVKELASGLQLDYGTLSPLLKRLEANGLVCRERRSDDERSVRVALTQAGASLGPRAHAVPRVLSEASGLDEAALGAIRDTLHRLTDLVSAARPPER